MLYEVSEKTITDIGSALMGMSLKRADNYTLWINVLQALASLKGTLFADAALELAHEFSKRCPEKYNPENLDSTWEGMSSSEITYRSVFHWAQEDGWINPCSEIERRTGESRIDRTDAGNMALLASIANGNLRYVPERNMWLWWDGTKWESDQHGVVSQNYALKIAEYYHIQAIEFRNQAKEESLETSESKRIGKVVESHEKWATQCRNKRAIDSMLSLAKSDKHFILEASKLDCNPWLFGVGNGVVDLRTGQLRDTCCDEYVTRRSPLNFDPNARAPRWCQFIEEITAFPSSTSRQRYSVRPELANYMQRAMGYTITGSTREQKMFIAFGAGANGKNVLLDTLQWVMGEYCQSIPSDALMAARYNSDAERPSPTTAMLAGARTAVSSESKDGQKLDVALVKKHTGGGFMTARYMRENTFRFEISHKLWLMTNHKPALDHLDDAVRGRLHLIPFDMRWNRPGHPEHDPLVPDGDKNLLEKLKDEGEGILAWLIAGAVAYAKEGLEAPLEVINVTRSYFQESDLLGQWINEVCETCEPNQGDFAAQLFDSFRDWCADEERKLSPNSQTAFSKELVRSGIRKHISKEGRRYGLQIPGGENGFNKVMDDG